MREGCLHLLLVCSYIFSITKNALSGDTITASQSLVDGQTLVSASSNFEFGFFRPASNSPNRYLGIWYKKISAGTVVWVANRNRPLSDNNGVLKIRKDGNLILQINQTETVVWASNSSRTTVNNPITQLLDSGNLVIREENDDDPSDYLWQSFDYPSDILLPGMKLGWNLRTGFNRSLTSWKSLDDPSPGDYRFGIDIQGFPQLVMWKNGSLQYRSGSWNGLRFTGTPQLNENPVFEFNFVHNQEEVYYITSARNNSVVTQLVMNQSGFVRRFTWNDRNRDWVLYTSLPLDQCDNYNLCGAYGTCNMDNSPICQCLEGFLPKNHVNWNSMDWSNGCARRTSLNCSEKGEGFGKYPGVKLPDTRNSWFSANMSLRECEDMCLKNCSCSAYASANVADGIGCLVWYGDLRDIRKLMDKGQDLYVKMPASELERRSSGRRRKVITAICVLLLTGMLILGVVSYFCVKKKKKRKDEVVEMSQTKYNPEEDSKELVLAVFDLGTISVATNNFSFDNKLGEGGFGPVYKGKLLGGQEIAVKRLSRNTPQLLREFNSEVELVAKLQHRNLVKLLGCCIQGEERMLIYEYMSNKSLDFYIFDEERSSQLDWQKRQQIINGVARGLVYLHQDSRLRIVHRDIKASNILLDEEMNPKISDFGLARSFCGDEIEANTSIVVGTYGYMSPEYTRDGLFSLSSDVFSFGVIVLEIITGKKNRGFNHGNRVLNLVGHVWRLWNEGNPSVLIDASLLENSCTLSEILRCMHVGLLCVQQCPEERPNMSNVVLMLGSETSNLPAPKHPGYFMENNSNNHTDSSSSNQEYCTATDVTVTLLESR